MIMSTTNGNTAEKTIYLGAFAHCTSLQEVEICESGAIGVDSNGKIAFIERDIVDIPAYQLRERKDGWEKAKVVQIQDQGFFFPGFIGKGCHPFTDELSKTDVMFNRYTYPRLSISKLWHLRQIDVTGLAQHLHISPGIIFYRSGKGPSHLRSRGQSYSIPRHNNSMLLRNRPRRSHKPALRHLSE
jgi:hypothetical protein